MPSTKDTAKKHTKTKALPSTSTKNTLKKIEKKVDTPRVRVIPDGDDIMIKAILNQPFIFEVIDYPPVSKALGITQAGAEKKLAKYLGLDNTGAEKTGHTSSEIEGNNKVKKDGEEKKERSITDV